MVMIERNGFPLVMGTIGAAVVALSGWRLATGGDYGAILGGGLALLATSLMLWQRRPA
jgi:hypothetical protein